MGLKLVSTLEMPREEWLKWRRKGIGGSDAASILGINPYRSAIAVWADKMGLLAEKEDSEQMRIGRDLEAYVASRWEEATGKKVRRTNYMYQDEGRPFMLANVDRMVIGENAALECKTTSAWNKSDFVNGEIPRNYYVQCMHYMSVMGFDKMYLAVLVLGKGFYHFEIDRDEKEIQALREAEQDFWEKYVIAEQPPAPDGSDSAREVLRTICPDDKTLDDEIPLHDRDSLLDQLQKIKEGIKAMESEKTMLENHILLELGNHPCGSGSRWRVKRTVTSRSSLDSQRLKKEHPDIYQKYSKTSVVRSLRVTAIKEGAVS